MEVSEIAQCFGGSLQNTPGNIRSSMLQIASENENSTVSMLQSSSSLPEPKRTDTYLSQWQSKFLPYKRMNWNV